VTAEGKNNYKVGEQDTITLQSLLMSTGEISRSNVYAEHQGGGGGGGENCSILLAVSVKLVS